MATHSAELHEVDEVRVTTLMDNFVDSTMDSTEVAKRFDGGPDALQRPQPIAEHGFAALVAVREGDRWRRLLFDTGSSINGLLHNLDAMSIDLSGVEAIALSHGHWDHTLGLPSVLERLGTRTVHVVVHPEAFLERRTVRPDRGPRVHPILSRQTLRRDNVELIETSEPTLLLEGAVLVSGEIARTTGFEVGLPTHQSRRDGTWQPDPLVRDDQCVAVNLRGKGLVIVSGCAHAGIVNTMRHVKALTGVERVHALVGGFHLSGKSFEQVILPTVAALQDLGPRYLVPTHCTGWAAVHMIAQAMPEAFVANSVGTTLAF